MGKLRSTLANGGVNQNISRMDAYSYTMDPIITQDLETKTSIMSDDFYSMFKKKYHSPAPAPHVYKHYYSEPPKSTTYIYKSPKPSKPHRNSNNDYDWFDGFDLFGCDDDADYDYSNESGSNESSGRRRRRNRDKKKKKKWIKILLFIAFLIAAKVCFHKMMHHYFPAVSSKIQESSPASFLLITFFNP
ncbi:unnamed protein product [Diamesa hyperborea]